MANLDPCAPGFATPREGIGTVIEITSTALQVLLDLRGYKWLSLLVGILPSFALHPGQYCADGPPERPTITTTDALALLNLGPADELLVATQKLRDLAQHYLWWDICECSGATTISPSDPQSPINVTGGPGDIGETCCEDFTNTQAYVKPVSGSNKSYVLTEYQWWQPSGDLSAGECDGDCKAVRITLDRTRGAGTHDDPMLYEVQFIPNFDGSFEAITQQFTFSGDHFTTDILTPGYPYGFMQGYFRITTENSNDTVSGRATCLCLGTPTRTPLDCCPPDPNIATAIALLQSDIANMRAQVDLIQRQAAPFAYIEDDAITGLTGHGHVDVQGLLGCLITIEELPDDAGLVDGDTQEVFADSWINWANASDATPREWIRGFSQLSFPRNAGVYTRISYTLRPGVQIAITPLVREP